MDTTRVSLLLRLKARDNSQAWQEFTAIYRPILLRYARACGLDAHDAEDIAQECLAQVNLSIGRFEYDKRRGGFKRWLRVMVKRRVINRLRKRRECLTESGVFRRPQAREALPEDEFEKIWLDEHLRFCLTKLRDEVEPRTCEAYQRHGAGWLDGRQGLRDFRYHGQQRVRDQIAFDNTLAGVDGRDHRRV